MKVYQAFQKWIKATYDKDLYGYQIVIAERILKGYLYDRIRKSSPEIAIEIARQAGKTTIVVDVVTFLMVVYGPVRIGIFAPQREQAKTDFDRLKDNLSVLAKMDKAFYPDESNSNTLRLSNGSECYIFPVTPTSHPESKTLDLIIVEEAQSLNDHEFMNDVRPMGASTNAPFIFIGSAGYRICYFYRMVQRNDAIIFNYQDVINDKRKMYELSKDSNHLKYEVFVSTERERLGDETDEFKVPYKLEWVLGGGQFTTSEQLELLKGDHNRTYQDGQHDCYAGIDSAKNPDSTVVTILRKTKIIDAETGQEKYQKQLINWLELRGDNYKDQFDIILDFLNRYRVVAIAIDSTGQGDFMPDMFERETQWKDEKSGLYRVKFSAISKDNMYKNLLSVIQNILTRIPRIETKEGERFRQQMLDLQKEYRGELLTAHHPNSPDAHDDYCDSWALAELAYNNYENTANIEIRYI